MHQGCANGGETVRYVIAQKAVAQCLNCFISSPLSNNTRLGYRYWNAWFHVFCCYKCSWNRDCLHMRLRGKHGSVYCLHPWKYSRANHLVTCCLTGLRWGKAVKTFLTCRGMWNRGMWNRRLDSRIMVWNAVDLWNLWLLRVLEDILVTLTASAAGSAGIGLVL